MFSIYYPAGHGAQTLEVSWLTCDEILLLAALLAALAATTLHAVRDGLLLLLWDGRRDLLLGDWLGLVWLLGAVLADHGDCGDG